MLLLHGLLLLSSFLVDLINAQINIASQLTGGPKDLHWKSSGERVNQETESKVGKFDD